jgi:hypothetical protein
MKLSCTRLQQATVRQRDQLVHHAYILGFTGPSFRYRDAVLARGGNEMDKGRWGITAN